MVNRLLRDDPSKGDMNNRQAVTLALLWKVLQEWEMVSNFQNSFLPFVVSFGV